MDADASTLKVDGWLMRGFLSDFFLKDTFIQCHDQTIIFSSQQHGYKKNLH